MDRLTRYQELRRIQQRLNLRLLDMIPDGKKGQRMITSAARELGYAVSGNRIELPEQAAEDRLQELILHEPNSTGKSLAQRFLEGEPALTSDERLLIEAMAGKAASLYEVTDMKRDACQMRMTGLLEDENEYCVTDIGFSKSGTKGALLFARIITVDDISFCSGVSMGYLHRYKDLVVKKLNVFSKLKSPHIRSRKRYVAAVKLEQHCGVTMVYR